MSTLSFVNYINLVRIIEHDRDPIHVSYQLISIKDHKVKPGHDLKEKPLPFSFLQ